MRHSKAVCSLHFPCSPLGLLSSENYEDCSNYLHHGTIKMGSKDYNIRWRFRNSPQIKLFLEYFFWGSSPVRIGLEKPIYKVTQCPPPAGRCGPGHPGHSVRLGNVWSNHGSPAQWGLLKVAVLITCITAFINITNTNIKHIICSSMTFHSSACQRGSRTLTLSFHSFHSGVSSVLCCKGIIKSFIQYQELW